ncbi:unnamed protein product [Malus baccata var. baccata]
MEGGQSSGIGRDPFEHQFSLENNTAGDVVDLGSSTDSPQLVNPTRSTESLTEAEFNNFFSNPSHEQPANLATNGISFSNLYAEAMGSNPEIMAQLNPEDSLPPISDAPNFLLPPLPEVTFSHLLPRECQPYPPHMEEQEFGSSAGNNGLNPANSTQNLMPGAAGFSSYQSSNPHFPYPQNENVGTPFFFNPLISSSTPPYRPVQMSVGDVMVEPFHEQEQLPLSLTLGPNQYATSTMMAGHSGGNQRPSYLNQQPAAFFYPQSVNPATQLLIPPGPQHNQVIQGYGAFNPQGNNSVSYGAAQIGPQPQYTLQLLNQPQQMNQVPENPFQAGEDSGIWVLESSLARAPPRQQQQINKGKAALARKAQNSNSNPLMQSRPRGVAKSRPSIPIPIRPRPSVLPNIADPPHHSSAPSKTQMPFRYLHDPYLLILFIPSGNKPFTETKGVMLDTHNRHPPPPPLLLSFFYLSHPINFCPLISFNSLDQKAGNRKSVYKKRCVDSTNQLKYFGLCKGHLIVKMMLVYDAIPDLGLHLSTFSWCFYIQNILPYVSSHPT